MAAGKDGEIEKRGPLFGAGAGVSHSLLVCSVCDKPLLIAMRPGKGGAAQFVCRFVSPQPCRAMFEHIFVCDDQDEIFRK